MGNIIDILIWRELSARQRKSLGPKYKFFQAIKKGYRIGKLQLLLKDKELFVLTNKNSLVPIDTMYQFFSTELKGTIKNESQFQDPSDDNDSPKAS